MSISKKTTAVILMIIMCVLLYSCGSHVFTDTDMTVEDMAAALIISQDELPVLYAVNTENADFELYKEAYLQDVSDSVEEGIICVPSGAEASEIAVFMFNNEKSAQEAQNVLFKYIDERVSAFKGYAPEQAAIAENGRVVVNGKYTAMLICSDPEKAQSTFLSCFSDDPPATDTSVLIEMPSDNQEPAEKPGDQTGQYDDNAGEHDNGEHDNDEHENDERDNGEYDRETVIKAWERNDPSLLKGKNLAVYNACKEIVGRLINDDMSIYDKELAIHDELISRAGYDEAVLNHLTENEIDPDNDNPYGLLIHGKAICLGYSSTFNLLMDMLDIECITVHGHSGSENEEHAWNMVHIDGDWYCVDVTWDDPIAYYEPSAAEKHRYFNVTSDYMRMTGHKWDESSVQEADGVLYAWK